MLERFFCPDSPVDGRVRLDSDETRHLSRVRRVAVGECVELFDGKGWVSRAEVVGIGRDQVDLRIVETFGIAAPEAFKLTLASAIPKGDRFDWLVEKATELGVDRVIPLVTERSSVDPRSAKLDRLRRAVIESSKQCRRNWLMELAEPTAFDTLVANDRASLKLIAHPGGRPIAGSEVGSTCSDVILAIGPEGGFTPRELAKAEKAGWLVVGLGSTVLRVETAAIAGAASLLALAQVHNPSKEV